MATFKPSQVNPNFVGSTFQQVEKECLAAQIVTFIANNGNEWECEIEVSMFFEHTRSYEFQFFHYNKPLANPFIAKGFVNAMYQLIEEGFVVWVEERKIFKVTEKLIQFYSQYVSE